MKGALLALLLAAPAAAEDYALPPPPPVGSHVDYSADRAEFAGEGSTLHLSGNVVLKQSTMTVKGDDLWIDTEMRTGISDRPVFVEDGVSAVYGDSGDFDFAHQTGRLTRAKAGMADWRIQAREAELGAGRRTKYRGADFTSCNFVPPHYHFHASSLCLVPQKSLWAWNTIFYLGPVPLFYTPFFYHSLDPDSFLKWRFQPGVDKRNGEYLKGTLTTRLSSTTYSKIFDDYYSNMGFGYGAELDHHAGLDSRGSIYGYRIREDGTVNNRWGLFGSDYQKFGSSVAFQGRLQFQSDPSFTNNYVRSDLFRLTPELINSAALSRTFSKGTVRVLYSRDDVVNPNNPNLYIRNTEDLPRVEAQSASLHIWKLPWLNTFSGFADDNYTVGRGYQQKSVNAAWEGTRSFRVAPRVTYTPKLDYGETYYNEFDETTWSTLATNGNLNSTVGRWIASNNLRFGTVIGNVDVTHFYSQRLKPDGVTEDTGPTDRGVEQNRVAVADIFVPAPRTWVRVGTGYDYRTYRDQTLHFNDRIQPITTDLSWQSSKRLVFTFHDDYQVQASSSGQGGNRSFIADVRWGDPDKGPSVGGGLSYNLTSPGTYYQSLDFAIAPSSPSWRVAVGLRWVVESPGGISRAHGGRLFEKELTWTRRWHDFYTKVVARVRPGGVGEVTASVEFKFGTSNPKQAPRQDWESEWYPGRAKEGDDLRP